MKLSLKDKLKKLGCSFRDCPKCAEVIKVSVEDNILTFTDSFGTEMEFILPNELILVNEPDTGWAVRNVSRINHLPIGDSAFDFTYTSTSPNASGASGQGAVAFGGNVKAVGIRSFATGTNNESNGQESAVFGLGNKSNGYRTFVAGVANTTTGKQSTMFGQGNNSDGDNTFVGGYFSTASGDRATSFGSTNSSSGFASTTLGFGNVAGGPSSLAAGRGTISPSSEGGVAFGTYNSPTTGSILEVGIGTSSSKKNLITGYTSGTVEVPETTNSKITTGGPKTLVTKEYVLNTLGFAINGTEQIMSGSDIQVDLGFAVSTDQATFSLANNTITANVDGIYKLTYKMNLEDRSGQRQNTLSYISLNGAEIPESRAYTYVRNASDGLATATFHGAKLLSAGDVVTFHVTNIGSGNINDIAILAGETFLQVEYIPNLKIGQ